MLTTVDLQLSRRFVSFLQGSHSPLELRQLVMYSLGEEAADALPGAVASPAALAQAVADALRRADAIDGALFDKLARALPRRGAEIEALRRGFAGGPAELRAGAPAQSGVSRRDVYVSISRLTPSQFGELLFCLELDASPHIPGPTATLATRAQTLIRLMEDRTDGLATLAEEIKALRAR